MSFFSSIKQFFGQSKEECHQVDLSLLPLVPNPLIPWEIYPNVDPDIFTCLQGNESFWVDEIWYPYWESLTEDEKKDLKAKAPTEAWRVWIDIRSKWAKKARIDHESRGELFDYNTYLEDFKINYIVNKLQNN